MNPETWFYYNTEWLSMSAKQGASVKGQQYLAFTFSQCSMCSPKLLNGKEILKQTHNTDNDVKGNYPSGQGVTISLPHRYHRIHIERTWARSNTVITLLLNWFRRFLSYFLKW